MPKTRRLSDATLVRRSQQGDRRAFTALLARYDWRLRGLANALLLDRAEMDAALGIGYLRAWRDVVRINPREDVAAWLYRVTYNACIDQLRRSGDGPLPKPARPRRSMAAGLAALPAADRVAVVLVDREGFSPASAARILGLDPATLATTLEAAREHLTAFLPAPDEASAQAAADDGRAEAAAEAAAAEAAAVASDPGAADRPVTAGNIGGGGGASAGGNGDGQVAAAGEAMSPVGNGATGAASPDGVDAKGDGDGKPTVSGAADDLDGNGAGRATVSGTAGDLDGNGAGRATVSGAGAGTVEANGAGRATVPEPDGDGPAGAADGNGDGRATVSGAGAGTADGNGDGRATVPGPDGDGPAGAADGNGDGLATASGAAGDGNGNGDGDGQAAGVEVDGAAMGRGNGHNPNRGRGRRARRRAQHLAGQHASDPVEPTDGTP